MWNIEQEKQPIAYGYALLASRDAQDWLLSLQQVEGPQTVRNTEHGWSLDARIAGRYFGVLAFRGHNPVLIAALTSSAWEIPEKSTEMDAQSAGHPLSWFPLIPWKTSLGNDLVTETVPMDSTRSEKAAAALRRRLTYRQPVLRLTCPAMSHDGKKYPAWSLSMAVAPSVLRRMEQARNAQGESRFILGRPGFLPILGWAVDWSDGETLIPVPVDFPTAEQEYNNDAPSPRMGWE